MSDHVINELLLAIALFTAVAEAGIFWMILQDFRKARGIPEVPTRRLLILGAFSLAPIVSLGLLYLFAERVRQGPSFGIPGEDYQMVPLVVVLSVLIGAALGYLLYSRKRDLQTKAEKAALKAQIEQTEQERDGARQQVAIVDGEVTRLKAELADAQVRSFEHARTQWLAMTEATRRENATLKAKLDALSGPSNSASLIKEQKLKSADEKTLEALTNLLPNEGGVMQLRDQPILGPIPMGCRFHSVFVSATGHWARSWFS